MKQTFFAALSCLILASLAAAQYLKPAWEPQPEELKQIYIEMEAIGKKCHYGLTRAPNDPELTKRVKECKERVNRYTRSHEGKDLNWSYWGRAFMFTYRCAFKQLPDEFSEAEKILREGLLTLEGAKSDDATVVPYVKLDIYEWLMRAWVETHPVESARVWDEAGEWVRETGDQRLLELWHCACATVEPQLLVWAAGRLEGDRYAAYAASRLKKIAEFVADESVEMRHRSCALRCAVEHLNIVRNMEAARALVKLLPRKQGVTPDYYYSRMLVALFGEGDWEKATEALSALNTAPALGRPLKPSEKRRQEMTYDLYYGHIFLPGPELLRRAVPEWEKDGKTP